MAIFTTVDRHFCAVTFFSRLGDFSQIADWYFRGWRAQTTRKFLFCSITSITCSKSRSWYFRGLDANRENRENMVTAEKWRFTVNILKNITFYIFFNKHDAKPWTTCADKIKEVALLPACIFEGNIPGSSKDSWFQLLMRQIPYWLFLLLGSTTIDSL